MRVIRKLGEHPVLTIKCGCGDHQRCDRVMTICGNGTVKVGNKIVILISETDAGKLIRAGSK
ncbi:hypothetical protein DRO66_03795 [Candidatus Bathyarchaeota archaeon]|nr:MAG: hypothetical protein DRO66_03795 [Candidatus Bathyarchaeota archaeon]